MVAENMVVEGPARLGYGSSTDQFVNDYTDEYSMGLPPSAPL